MTVLNEEQRQFNNPYSSLLGCNMSTTEEHKITPIPVVPRVTGSWREIAVRWVFEQGFSNVLLVAILIASVLGIPKVLIPSIHDGYRLNAKALEESSKNHVESTERLINLIMINHEKDRQTFERAVEVMERIHK